MNQIAIPHQTRHAFRDIITDETLAALEFLLPLNEIQAALMVKRQERRKQALSSGKPPAFLSATDTIPGTGLTVAQAREGNFEGSEIPAALKRQWVQGTGPATRPSSDTASGLRNVAYALLSGADGWMFDGEDALGQIGHMSLENQRNLKLAIANDPTFLAVAEQVSQEMNHWSQSFFGREIIQDWQKQLDFTTIIFRARGLHLSDRHVAVSDHTPFSASICDVVFFIVNNYNRLQKKNAPLVLYLPKIQTAEEASFWNRILTELEDFLTLEKHSIKTYVLVEQLEATFQLMEIRAALGKRFVGFNTGRWDYINSVSDALVGIEDFVHPDIESITMTYPYMAAYEDRVRRAVNTPDLNGNFALWQGGMEPNIPVGSPEGVKAGMEKAIGGASREQNAGASGKWVAHWKMVHIIRPVWEEAGQENQLGRIFDPLGYTEKEAKDLITLDNTKGTMRGARNLISVGLQYANAFLRGYQAAALKPADFFGDDHMLYLMEDMATGEIRLSILWEWIHKSAPITGDQSEIPGQSWHRFDLPLFLQILNEEYEKLLVARDKDVHDSSKNTTLPISLELVMRYVSAPVKAPWFIDLLNLNLDHHDIDLARERVDSYYEKLKVSGERITQNIDLIIT